MLYNSIKHILPQFCFEGSYMSVEELHSGNVNSTYHLVYRKNDGSRNHYILQQINNYAFKDPGIVMQNISLVTEHLRKAYVANGENPQRRMLELIPAKGGGVLFSAAPGSFWRAYKYIDRATAYDRVVKPEHFYETGRAFGEFQRLLSNFPADQLHETIPDFHNTMRRFYAFVASVAEDRVGRVAMLEEEIEFFFEHRKLMKQITSRIENGELPLRVTHNDTKINNVMIDNETDKAICVIDLDTVMPGSVLYDFGDAIRFGASTADEDEQDLSKIHLDLDLFKLFAEGFLSETNGFLTENELRLLPLGVQVITCELAMRFLTDYIDGDLYFKVRSPDHNLIRARAQIQLLKDIEEKADIMQKIIDDMIDK